jgi:chromosome segregation ATPase
VADQEASFMAQPSLAAETPDVAEIISFLRRFADLMSNGYNASYLHQASNLLETLAARAITACDEEDLWRYKLETLASHSDALEAECEALKNDIEGHLDITSSVLAERDALAATLQAREAELAEFRVSLSSERDQRAAKSAAYEEALVQLREAFDQKLVALQVSLRARGEECDQLRSDLERERGDSAEKLGASEAESYRLRGAFDRERSELQAELRARGDEVAVFRTASKREIDTLQEKIAALEAGRATLRSAFDQINYLRNRTTENPKAEAAGAAVSGANFDPLPVHGRGQLSTAAENNAVVPKATLRQVRAQFEYLAREFMPLGDIASQVMCELGAYSMELALVAGQPTEQLPVGEVARSILAPVCSDQG